MSTHTITVLVENKPGVLARVSSMFARRGFNIHSLTVGPTEEPGMSRMTVVVDGPEMEQVVKQLRKLINTVKVTEHAPEQVIEREIMMVRITATSSNRGEVMDAATIFNAVPVDVGPATITFALTGEPDRLADFLELMRPYGIVELVKSGRIAMGRDPKAGRSLRSVGNGVQ